MPLSRQAPTGGSLRSIRARLRERAGHVGLSRNDRPRPDVAHRSVAAQPGQQGTVRNELTELQLTVADLVSAPELDDFLQQVTIRAAGGVAGGRCLLAVQLEDERTPRYHAHGVTPAQAAAGAAALLAGRDPVDPGWLVVEIRSARHRYGWLAADLGPAGGEGGELQQLQTFARLAAAALDLATAIESAHRRQQRTEALLQLGHDLAGEEDEHGIARRVGAAVPAVVGASRALVMIWDGDLHGFRVVAAHGFGAQAGRVSGFTVPHEDATDEVAAMGRAPRQRWFTPGEPITGGGTVADWDASVVATAPVIVRGRFAALLVAVWDEDQPPLVPRERLLAKLGALGDQAGTALNACRALAEARHRATHDALTGLANRVLFNEHSEQALADARRSGRHPAVCFIDLDGFKAVNDAEGHAVGDQLLVEVGARILATIREGDVAARLSGDEFGVLLRGLEVPAAAGRVAADLVAALGAPYRIGAREYRVSASVGVATASPSVRTADELLIAADTAMYRAKATRGTYRVASGEDLLSP